LDAFVCICFACKDWILAPNCGSSLMPLHPRNHFHAEDFLMWTENSACRQQSSGGFGCHKHKAAADEEEESDKLKLVLPIVVRFCKL
jgi:hypothetical protein